MAKGRYYLRPLPPPAEYKAKKGKHIFLRSVYPPLAQVIENGEPKALLRIVREPLFYTELLPAAGALRVDFFNQRLNQVTPNGLTLTEEDTNMVQPGTLGDPEVNILYPVRKAS